MRGELLHKKNTLLPLKPTLDGSDFGSVGLSCSVRARMESCSELFNIFTNWFVLLIVSLLLPKAAHNLFNCFLQWCQ